MQLHVSVHLFKITTKLMLFSKTQNGLEICSISHSYQGAQKEPELMSV